MAGIRWCHDMFLEVRHPGLPGWRCLQASPCIVVMVQGVVRPLVVLRLKRDPPLLGVCRSRFPEGFPRGLGFGWHVKCICCRIWLFGNRIVSAIFRILLVGPDRVTARVVTIGVVEHGRSGECATAAASDDRGRGEEEEIEQLRW